MKHSMKLRVFDATKRIFDAGASGVALLVLSPIIGATAIAVALRLGRPVLFRQERPGLHGEVFELVKFRTMLNEDVARGIVSNEDRMTTFGARLRATSLDELPSLWNIVRGDMSLVGPRPLLVKYLPLYTPSQARRHEVRPGLTGLAQVNGRNALDWNSRFKLDVQYVENRSWRLDIKILLQTVDRVFRRDGIVSDGSVVGEPFSGQESGS